MEYWKHVEDQMTGDTKLVLVRWDPASWSFRNDPSTSSLRLSRRSWEWSDFDPGRLINGARDMNSGSTSYSSLSCLLRSPPVAVPNSYINSFKIQRHFPMGQTCPRVVGTTLGSH